MQLILQKGSGMQRDAAHSRTFASKCLGASVAVSPLHGKFPGDPRDPLLESLLVGGGVSGGFSLKSTLRIFQVRSSFPPAQNGLGPAGMCFFRPPPR